MLTFPNAKFALGHIVATPAALSLLNPDEQLVALSRHASGDWGYLCPEDKAANDEALTEGLRILSSFKTSSGTKFWIITEADRSSTTILLPSDY